MVDGIMLSDDGKNTLISKSMNHQIQTLLQLERTKNLDRKLFKSKDEEQKQEMQIEEELKKKQILKD